MGLGLCGTTGNRGFLNKELREEAARTFLEYVAGRSIYKLFRGVEKMKGSSRILGWWYQEHVPTQTEKDVQ